MKILHILPSLSGRVGGPAKAVKELSELSVQNGHTVSIFSLEPEKEFLNSKEATLPNGLNIRLFPRTYPGRYGYSLLLKKALEVEIEKFCLVHIHGLWVYPTLVASRLCEKKKIPYIIRPCGMLDRFSMSQHPFRKRLYCWLFEGHHLKKASAVHFTSTEEQKRSVLGFAVRGAVLPLGLRWQDYENLPTYGTFRRNYPQWEGKKIVLFLGRIHYKKGLDLLIDAFAGALKEISTLHLVLVGPDDEGHGRIFKNQIRQKGLDGHVTWIGYIEGDQKLALLRDSDVFCLPSRQENFCFSVLEAMAVGLPVIISDQVNIYDTIQRENAGLVVSCQVPSISSALKKMVQDESWCVRTGKKSRELVKREFSWNISGEKILSFYETLVKSC